MISLKVAGSVPFHLYLFDQQYDKFDSIRYDCQVLKCYILA